MGTRAVREVLAAYAALSRDEQLLVLQTLARDEPAPGERESQSPETSGAALVSPALVREPGAVWRYSDEALSHILLEAMRAVGHPPTVAEFDAWRAQHAAAMRATGKGRGRLPSTAPYRRRWGSWLRALAHHGADETTVFQIPGDEFDWRRVGPNVDVGLPGDLLVAELSVAQGAGPLADDKVQALLHAWSRLPRRTRYVLTSRLELLGPSSTFKALGGALGVSARRVQQVHGEGYARLCRDVLGPQADEAAREAVAETLRRLAAPSRL